MMCLWTIISVYYHYECVGMYVCVTSAKNAAGFCCSCCCCWIYLSVWLLLLLTWFIRKKMKIGYVEYPFRLGERGKISHLKHLAMYFHILVIRIFKASTNLINFRFVSVSFQVRYNTSSLRNDHAVTETIAFVLENEWVECYASK